jgi:hypothetical protein
MLLTKEDYPSKDEENELLSLLITTGFIFPENKEELDFYLESLVNFKENIPQELSNPLEVLKNFKSTKVRHIEFLTDSLDFEYLAMVAREGGIIDEEVLTKMEQDRKKTENESNSQMG